MISIIIILFVYFLQRTHLWRNLPTGIEIKLIKLRVLPKVPNPSQGPRVSMGEFIVLMKLYSPNEVAAFVIRVHNDNSITLNHGSLVSQSCK